MSRFISKEAVRLKPYTPGEQPADMQYIKLNTNESPFPPAPGVVKAVSRAEIMKLNLYSDPACTQLVEAIAKRNGLRPEQVMTGNGSDEILSFAFRAFCGEEKGAAFPDVTYGFYKVWAAYYGIEAKIIPLKDDFTIDVNDYMDFPGAIFLANPNALTGVELPVEQIRRLLDADRDRVVIVDEAYVDFGGESCVPLLNRYDNLLVVQTFSKSRDLAGARLGFAMGCPELIADLNRMKFSFNPYNINRLSILAGAASMADEAYFQKCTAAIQENRARTVAELERLGFSVLPSKANFIFAKSPDFPGGELYRRLKQNGILVRWFDEPRIRDYYRITIGSAEQMERLLEEIRRFLGEV